MRAHPHLQIRVFFPRLLQKVRIHTSKTSVFHDTFAKSENENFPRDIRTMSAEGCASIFDAQDVRRGLRRNVQKCNFTCIPRLRHAQCPQKAAFSLDAVRPTTRLRVENMFSFFLPDHVWKTCFLFFLPDHVWKTSFLL